MPILLDFLIIKIQLLSKQEASHRVSDGGPDDLKEGTIAPGDGDPSKPPVPGTVLPVYS